MIYGTQKLPLYGTEYLFLFAHPDERAKIADPLGRFFKDIKYQWLNDLPDKGGNCIHDRKLHRIAITLVGDFDEIGGIATMALIAHECLHATHQTFAGMSADWGLDCIETQCYLLQWLVTQALLVYERRVVQKPDEGGLEAYGAPEALQGMNAKKSSYT